MTETFLKNTLQKLIERWGKANFQYDLIATIERDVKLSLYSTHNLYNFSAYEKSDTWPPEDWLQPSVPDHFLFNEYCYSTDNTPLIVKKYYNGTHANTGVFFWHEDQWEYIEFNVSTLVCSSYESIYFKEGKKDLFISIRLNGGTFQYGADNIPATEIAQKLAENSYAYFAEIKRYNYKNDHIITADSLSNLPGIGEYFTTDYYTYHSKGNLDKITSHNANDKKQIIYIALSGRSVNTLIKSIAIQMAEYLTSCISQTKFKQKLSCVIINYQYCYNYWPSFSLISEAEMLDDVNTEALIFPMGQFYSDGDIIVHKSEKLLEDFAELEQIIVQEDKQELGEKMLLETAKLMTLSRLNKVTAVSKDFFVFPIDPTLHNPPSEKILKACGASAMQIKLWRKLKWLE